MKTAIENGLDSKRYLEFLFTEFGSKPIKDATPYLPWLEEMQKKFESPGSQNQNFITALYTTLTVLLALHQGEFHPNVLCVSPRYRGEIHPLEKVNGARASLTMILQKLFLSKILSILSGS